MDATLFSLQYGLPLYAYAEFAVQYVCRSTPVVNILVPSTTLAVPSETQVAEPNVDTLYSAAINDLYEHDVIVVVPEVDADRYWNFAFYDPYGDNFADIGSVGGNSSGQYLLRRAEDCGQEAGYQASDGSDGYQGYINSPTTDGSLLVRILVKNNGSDLNYTQSLIKECKEIPIPRQNTNSNVGAPLSNKTFASFLDSTNTSLIVMDLLAQLASSNLPLNASDVEHVNSELCAAGISNGEYNPPPGVNLTLAYAELNASLAAYEAVGFQSLGNGWVHNVPQGIYYSNYLDRDLAAIIGYLEQEESQALYPVQIIREMNLTSSQSIMYTFSSKPPVASDGFWSLTLYNTQGGLVANPENKYSVGDRSNITYPDGSQIYASNSTDGSFQVLVQPYSVPPPSNWTNNWLPAPADGSDFSITLRLYAPTTTLEDGGWAYPIVTEGDAITS